MTDETIDAIESDVRQRAFRNDDILAVIAEARRARAAEAALKGSPMADDTAREIERQMNEAPVKGGYVHMDVTRKDLLTLLADRRYSQMLVADKLEDDDLAREERRKVVAWLKGYAWDYDGSYGDQARVLDEAANAIEAGRHTRPQEGTP